MQRLRRSARAGDEGRALVKSRIVTSGFLHDIAKRPANELTQCVAHEGSEAQTKVPSPLLGRVVLVRGSMRREDGRKALVGRAATNGRFAAAMLLKLGEDVSAQGARRLGRERIGEADDAVCFVRVWS